MGKGKEILADVRDMRETGIEVYHGDIEGEKDQKQDIKALKCNYWEATLLYGNHIDFCNKIYAVKVISKLGDKEGYTFFLNQLESKKGRKEALEIMSTFGRVEEHDIERIYEYAVELQINDKYHKANLDIALAEHKAEDIALKFENKIIEYVEENSEKFVSKESGEFERSEHDGVWLNTERYKRKYGEVALAICSDVLQRIIQIPNNTQYNAVKEGLIRGEFLIGEAGGKHTQDITFASKKQFNCYVFKIKSKLEGRQKNAQ